MDGSAKSKPPNSWKPSAGTSWGSRDPIIFWHCLPHGNVDSHEYKLL